MTVEELIRALSCFETDHHVIVHNENMHRNYDCEITDVVYDGQCTIRTISED